jgi:hypothetical protein
LSQNIHHSYQVASSQVAGDGKAPGFYFAEIGLEFDGASVIQVLTDWPALGATPDVVLNGGIWCLPPETPCCPAPLIPLETLQGLPFSDPGVVDALYWNGGQQLARSNGSYGTSPTGTFLLGASVFGQLPWADPGVAGALYWSGSFLAMSGGSYTTVYGVFVLAVTLFGDLPDSDPLVEGALFWNGDFLYMSGGF